MSDRGRPVVQRRSSSSARITLLGQWGRFAAQVVSFVILARLLPPTDFGLVAMVSAVMTLAALIADLGLSLAAIREPELSRAQRSSLFWVNLLAGAVAAGAVVLSGPTLAAYYHEQRVVVISVVLAGTLLVASASVQFRVELNRQGRFGALALQDTCAVVIAAVVAVVAALLGAGYWAVVLQAGLQPLVVLAMAAVQAKWWPGRTAPLREVRELLRFGGNNLLLQIANLASRTADVMAVGRWQGPAELGLYNRSAQLTSMVFQQIVSPLTRVVLPRLSAATNDPGQFEQIMLQLQRAIAIVLVGALGLAIATAPAILPLVLGADWSRAATIFQPLATGGIFTALGYVYYWGYLAHGKTGRLLVVELPGRVVMIVGAFAAAPFGTVAVAWAIAVGQLVTLVQSLLSARAIGVDGYKMLAACLRPLSMYAVATITAVIAMSRVSDPLPASIVGALVWLGVILLFVLVPAYRRDVVSVVNLVRS